MKKTSIVTLALGFLVFGMAVITISMPFAAQPGDDKAGDAKAGDDNAAPIFVTKIPDGYRDWKLISVAHEEGNLNSLGAILGNDAAIKAYREGKLPYPDGAIIAALHWRHASSDENNKIFGQSQSFVAGSPTNVQFMVKDSNKYASTGGWGFGHFNERDGNKPGAEALMKTCFLCHQKAKDSDLVFTHYAP